ATLCLASSLSVLNTLALAPFLARIAPDLGTSVALLAQALTLTGLLGALLGLVIGPVAEALGYRRLLLGGVAALVLCDIGTALAAAGCGLLGVIALPADAPLARPTLSMAALRGTYAPLLAYRPVALIFGAQFLRGVCWTGLLAYDGAFIVEALHHSVQLAGLS